MNGKRRFHFSRPNRRYRLHLSCTVGVGARQDGLKPRRLLGGGSHDQLAQSPIADSGFGGK